MTENQQSRRRTFWPMSGTYLLGVFNDNFFKEAAILMAFAAGMGALQSSIIKYFSLPFILFSAMAGYFADRFPKRNVIIASKYLELLAMGLGALGIMLGNFPLIVAMVFVMALQSTLFGPALNGTIPELYQPKEVPKVNGLLKMITTVSVIVGIMLAGMIMDMNWQQLGWSASQVLSGVVVAVALAGLILSHRLRKSPLRKENSGASFPWAGPFQSLRDAARLRRNPRLFKALLGSVFFYFASTLVLADIHELCLNDLSLSNAFTSALTGIIAIGVATGSLLSIRLSKSFSHDEIFPLAVIGFGVMLLMASVVAPGGTIGVGWHLGVTLFLAGAFGGAFLIPLLTYIQVTPKSSQKGRVLGVNNFLDFLGIFLAGELFGWLHPVVSVKTILAVVGGFAVIVAATFFFTNSKEQCHA